MLQIVRDQILTEDMSGDDILMVSQGGNCKIWGQGTGAERAFSLATSEASKLQHAGQVSWLHLPDRSGCPVLPGG